MDSPSNRVSTEAPKKNPPPASPTSSKTSTMVHSQLTPYLIPTPYVDRRKLLEKLKHRFGTDGEGNNNFRVQVRKRMPSRISLSQTIDRSQLRLNRWTIFIPEK